MLNKDFFLNSHTQKNVVNQGQKYKISLFRKYNLLYWRKILLGLFIFSLFSNFYFPILTFNSQVFMNAYQGLYPWNSYTQKNVVNHGQKYQI